MAMERLADEGLCKTIGISNFSVAKTKELIQTSRHPPVVNQASATATAPCSMVKCQPESLAAEPLLMGRSSS